MSGNSSKLLSVGELELAVAIHLDRLLWLMSSLLNRLSNEMSQNPKKAKRVKVHVILSLGLAFGIPKDKIVQKIAFLGYGSSYAEKLYEQYVDKLKGFAKAMEPFGLKLSESKLHDKPGKVGRPHVVYMFDKDDAGSPQLGNIININAVYKILELSCAYTRLLRALCKLLDHNSDLLDLLLDADYRMSKDALLDGLNGLKGVCEGMERAREERLVNQLKRRVESGNIEAQKQLLEVEGLTQSLDRAEAELLDALLALEFRS